MDKSLPGIAHDYYEEERIVGYDVQYQYNGRIYHARMDRDPGPRVRVRVNVAVAKIRSPGAGANKPCDAAPN